MSVKAALHPVALPRRRPVSRLSPGFLFRWLMSRRDLARQHRALLNLEDRLLDDIGLSRGEALHGVSRGRWDAPAHWTEAGPGPY